MARIYSSFIIHIQCSLLLISTLAYEMKTSRGVFYDILAERMSLDVVSPPLPTTSALMYYGRGPEL